MQINLDLSTSYLKYFNDAVNVSSELISELLSALNTSSFNVELSRVKNSIIRLNIIKMSAPEFETSINSLQNDLCITALRYVIGEGSAENCRKLLILAKNYKMHLYENKTNSSFLFEAVLDNKINIIKVLIEEGFEVNSKYNGTTPLILAIRNNNLEIVNELISYKASLELVDDNGDTPLFIAVFQNNMLIIKALVHAGADVNKVCANGFSPLSGAILFDKTTVMQVLIEAKAKLNTEVIVNNHKQGLLELAAIHKSNYEATKILIENGQKPLEYKIPTIDPSINKLLTIQEEIFSLLNTHINTLNIKSNNILLKLNNEEEDLVIKTILNASKDFSSKTEIIHLIVHMKHKLHQGELSEKVYKSVMHECPEIVKFCIEKLVPICIGFKRTIGVSEYLDNNVFKELLKFLSPTGYTYQGYSYKTGLKATSKDMFKDALDIKQDQGTPSLEEANLIIAGENVEEQ